VTDFEEHFSSLIHLLFPELLINMEEHVYKEKQQYKTKRTKQAERTGRWNVIIYGSRCHKNRPPINYTVSKTIKSKQNSFR
jgi:hypothetical protein